MAYELIIYDEEAVLGGVQFILGLGKMEPGLEKELKNLSRFCNWKMKKEMTEELGRIEEMTGADFSEEKRILTRLRTAEVPEKIKNSADSRFWRDASFRTHYIVPVKEYICWAVFLTLLEKKPTSFSNSANSQNSTVSDEMLSILQETERLMNDYEQRLIEGKKNDKVKSDGRNLFKSFYRKSGQPSYYVYNDDKSDPENLMDLKRGLMHLESSGAVDQLEQSFGTSGNIVEIHPGSNVLQTADCILFQYEMYRSLTDYALYHNKMLLIA